LKKQERSLGISEREKIKIAVKSLGLDDLAPFNPEEKIIEYIIEKNLGSGKKLVDMTLTNFANETLSESPAPGGGSVSAYCGALGAALAGMVANLSAHKRGWDARWEEFSTWAVKAKEIQDELNWLVDEDTHSFNKIMEAFGLPKNTEEEKLMRSEAIQNASKYAMQIPMQTARVAYKAFDICEAMIKDGNPNSVTDAGVGALAIRTAVIGACYNVRVNASGIADKSFTNALITEAATLEELTNVKDAELRNFVLSKIA
jgi:glutamate formiminotransferase/formiminotetrahydrofolate cyclodeaminase